MPEPRVVHFVRALRHARPVHIGKVNHRERVHAVQGMQIGTRSAPVTGVTRGIEGVCNHVLEDHADMGAIPVAAPVDVRILQIAPVSIRSIVPGAEELTAAD